MKKYTLEPQPMKPVLIKFRPDQIEAAGKIHKNFNESVRDALDKWIEENKEYAK